MGAANDQLFVQPRVLARTQEVTRAVVEVKTLDRSTSVSVSVPRQRVAQSSSPRSVTEEEFLQRLATSESPQVIDKVKEIIEKHHRTGWF